MTALFAFLALLVGLYVGLVLPYYVTMYVSNRGRKKEIKTLIPTDVDQTRLCLGRHLWIEVISANDSGEYAPINVCSECGFIPAKNLMASKDGLKRILENRALREFDESVAKDFSDKETLDINNLVEEFKKESTYEKAVQIYFAGQSANKRYIIYKIARSEEKRREPKDNL